MCSVAQNSLIAFPCIPRRCKRVDNPHLFGHIDPGDNTPLSEVAKHADALYPLTGVSSIMFWLKLIQVAAILTVGIFVIAWLEDILVSAPRRRTLARKAREKLNGKPDADGNA